MSLSNSIEISFPNSNNLTLTSFSGQVSVEVEEPAEAIKAFTAALEILGLESVLKYNLSLRLHLHNVIGKYLIIW